MVGATRQFVDEHWNLYSIRIATLNISCLPKNSEPLCAIVQDIAYTYIVVDTNLVVISTVTTYNEPATAPVVDLYTNFGGSGRCVSHTLSLVLNDEFKESTGWQTYVDHINNFKSYFNYHPKAEMLLQEKQLDAGVTQDRLQRSKRDVPTRWHSRLGPMTNVLLQIANISVIVGDHSIPFPDLRILSEERVNCLVAIVSVLKEVSRVACQLEVDRYVSMSRALPLINELHEALQIMSGDIQPSSRHFYETKSNEALMLFSEI